MLKLLLVNVVGLLLLLNFLNGEVSGEIYFEENVPHVKLASGGILSGRTRTSREGREFSSFVGITYATIPERFAEAKLVTEATWEGVKSAVTPGPICAQGPFFVHPMYNEITVYGEEDCLSLNVYVPKSKSAKDGFPVMMWIHGGGYILGGGYGQGPRFFMDEDVILVTINYRLGAFGFLSTGDSVVPGNNGLKDMVAALQWIQKNIKNFGGNPNKVTIFGESAGGNAVHQLRMSPKAKGLFHRAIQQSGAALQSHLFHPDPKQNAVDLAKFMKCPTTASEPSKISSEEILTCLKSATKDEIIKAQMSFKKSWPMNILNFHFGPAAEVESEEGASSLSPFLTGVPFEMATDPKYPISKVPTLFGVTEDEGAVFLAGVVLQAKQLTEELDQKWNDVAPMAFEYYKLIPKDKKEAFSKKLREFYFGSKPVSIETSKNLTDLYSDIIMNYFVSRSALETALREKDGNKAYLFQYAHHGPVSALGFLPCPDEQKQMVGHADEIILLFDMSGEAELEGEDHFNVVEKGSQHEEFSKNFVKLWASFATHGEPKHAWGNSPDREWKPVSVEEARGKSPLKWYRIDSNPGFIQHPYKERMAFWDKVYKNDYAESPLLKSASNKLNKKTEL